MGRGLKGIVGRQSRLDTPIGAEAERAVRLLHVATKGGLPRPAQSAGVHDRQPEGRRGQDDHRRQRRGRARAAGAAGARHRPRPAGQRQHRARHRAPRRHTVVLRGADRRDPGARPPCSAARTASGCSACRRRSTLPAPRSNWSAWSPARAGCAPRSAELNNHDFDYVFIDCPPSLGLLTINALVAAPEVLIPIQCEYYALEGVGQLLRNIEMVKAHLNPDAERVHRDPDDVRRAHQAGRSGRRTMSARTSATRCCGPSSRAASRCPRRRATA